jgi:iron complex outermembrane receptor protein
MRSTSITRTPGFAQGSFINANTIKTSGIDFGVNATIHINDHIKFITSGEASYVFKLNTTLPVTDADGNVIGTRTEHYAGTLGNFNLTAGSGTQRWKGELAEHARLRQGVDHRDRLLHERLPLLH